jgi:hypothetical protein
MGYSSTSTFDFRSYSSTAASYKAAATPTAAFKARSLDPYLDPSKFMVRESRNSVANPKSTPVILGLDVTGSMGTIAQYMAGEGLGNLIKEIVERNPVTDPHIMFQAIGDVTCDRSPFQVSQFETDLKLIEQLGKIHVEQGGGGNSFESYNVPWHFAAYHTSCDAFEKDGRKGFLFTMGDEMVPPDLTDNQLLQIYGRTQEPAATNKQLLEALSSKYHVFHLMIEQGSHMQFSGDAVRAAWTNLLGQRAIPVSDYKKISEIVISTMQVVAGVDKATVVKSWSGDTSIAVHRAIDGLSIISPSPGGGLIRF